MRRAIKIGKDAQLKIGGKLRRNEDQRKLTQPPERKERTQRRAANRQAKASRKANR